MGSLSQPREGDKRGTEQDRSSAVLWGNASRTQGKELEQPHELTKPSMSRTELSAGDAEWDSGIVGGFMERFVWGFMEGFGIH